MVMPGVMNAARSEQPGLGRPRATGQTWRTGRRQRGRAEKEVAGASHNVGHSEAGIRFGRAEAPDLAPGNAGRASDAVPKVDVSTPAVLGQIIVSPLPIGRPSLIACAACGSELSRLSRPAGGRIFPNRAWSRCNPSTREWAAGDHSGAPARGDWWRPELCPRVLPHVKGRHRASTRLRPLHGRRPDSQDIPVA